MGQVSNINVRHRLTQVLILVTVILLTAVFSQAAKAQGVVRYNKAKFRIAVHKNSKKSCYIMNKKRMSRAKHDLIASSRRTTKSRPMAETDESKVVSD